MGNLKKFALVMGLALVSSLYNGTSAQTSIEENDIVRSALDEMFEDLDKSRVPTGYLLDYAVDLVELSDYDGSEITDSNYVDRALFADILRSVRSASVNATASAVIPAGATDMSDPLVALSSTEVSVAAFKYNYIVANALTDGLIEYDEASGKASDSWKGGVWQNPYGESHLLAFAPMSAVMRSQNVEFNFPSSMFYKNETLSELYFDAGDGGGYREIGAGSTVSASYSGNGKKELRLKAVTGSGEVLEAHSAIYVAYEPMITGWGTGGGALEPSFVDEYDETWNGITVSAQMTCYMRDGATLRRPFIVAEGFEPLELEKLLGDIESDLGYNRYDSLAKYFYGYDTPLKEQYDLVYVDWFNSTEDIRANAALFIKLLKEVNRMKAMAGSTEKNVVMGQSMGGLVARYALRTMELNGEEHETTTYISHDSPHKGANVPLGALYFVHQLMSMAHGYDNLVNVADLFMANKLTNAEMAVYNTMHSMAARQMLVNYVDPSGNLDNSVHNDWQAELDLLGFPEGDNGTGIQNLTIVNGREYDIASSLVYGGHLLYLDGYFKSSFLSDILGSLATLAFSPILGPIMAYTNIEELFIGLACLGSSQLNVHVEVNPLSLFYGSSKLSEISLYYTKKFLWLFPKTYTMFSSSKNIPRSSLYYDDYPGSVYSIVVDEDMQNIDKSNMFIADTVYVKNESMNGWWGSYSMDLGVTNRIMFIPAASALAIKGDSPSDFTRDYYTDIPKPEEETFFDAYYLYSEVTEHIFYDAYMFNWIADCLEGEISGPEYVGKEEVQYSLAGSDKTVAWSTSSSAVATIDNTGKLTPQGTGMVKIIAESVSGGSLYRKTKEVMVSYAPTILLDYEYSPETGFNFVAECMYSDEQDRLDRAVTNGDLEYEWSLKVGEEDMTTWTTSSNKYNYVPESDSHVLVMVRIVDNEGNSSSIKHLSFDLQAPFEPNYTYVIVNSDRNVYFVKSDETYDEGYLSEDYTVALRNVDADLIPSDLVSGGSCYLKTGVQQYLEGTRHGVAPYYEWSFDFFDTADFLFALRVVGEAKLKDASGTVLVDHASNPEEILLTGYGFSLNVCNSSKVAMQKIPFSVIYKEEFPEESSAVIIGDWRPIGGIDDINDNFGIKP